nr:MAG TPA: hypothetical protein [Caudoviricetes sp.]
MQRVSSGASYGMATVLIHHPSQSEFLFQSAMARENGGQNPMSSISF